MKFPFFKQVFYTSSNEMKKLIPLYLICAFSALLGQGVYFFRDGFSLKRLHAEPTTLCSIDEETKKILSQPFHYLGRGRQCFAFASQDEKYVLKCVRADKFKVPFWMQLFPKLYQAKHDKIARKKRLVFESFRIAKEELSELTGTIALHLGKSEKTEQMITISDPLGIRHQLPLDSTIFILQYKRPLWSKAFRDSSENEKQQLVDAFVDLVIARAQKGILNRDPNFLPNYGFEGGKTFQIDIGDFRRDPNFVYHKALRDSLSPLQSWLAKTDPPMLNYLNARLEKL